ncbi:MAG TPA: Ig-like domain-containing protein [Nannocystaceae bacterium]|nr:Ig-like domain-containing protein [Nannocystaceae bacterium]
MVRDLLSARTPMLLVTLVLCASPDPAYTASAPPPARDLGRSRGLPRAVPSDAPRLRAIGAPKLAKQGVLFVNFDGAELSSGWDDSINDVTQIGECAGSFAAYGDGSMRDAVMQAVRTDWAAFDMVVTDTRPASGDYVMNMTGPSNPFGGGVLGIAPLDCDDSETPNNITFAFVSANDGLGASEHATTIGQEVAHSFGLEHVGDEGDIMNPYVAGGDPSFKDECIGIVNGGSCPDQHAAECGDAYSQNSFRELMTLFGPSTPDAAAPTVAITFPMDGQELDNGTDFAIMVDASDDQGIAEVTLYQDGEAVASDGSAPYSWQVNGLPAGVYELYAKATDLSGNEAMSDTVTIGIGHAPPPSDDGGVSDSGDAGDDGGGVDDGGNVDDGGPAGDDGGDEGEPVGGTALPPGFGLDGAEEGCACSSATPRTPVFAAFFAFVCCARRRERR